MAHTGPAGNLLADFHYDYDPAGQLLSESNLTENIDYVHDATGQLTEANRTQWPSETYTYDPSGNRTLFASSAPFVVTNTYTIGAGNRVLYDGEHTLTHDDEGNLVSKTVTATGEKWAYTYDHRNRLTAVVQSDAAGQETLTVTFTYDPFDRRVRKTVSAASAPLRETLFLYDGENLWSESTTENGTRKTEHHLSGPALDQWLASQSPGQGLGWSLPDRLGSIRAIAASDGAVLSQQDYASYGAIHPIQGTPSRLAFTGREWDQETGLYYYRARYYEPGLGSFMGQDPLGFGAGDFSLSRYAFNSPVLFSDPLGLTTDKEYAKIISAISTRMRKCLIALGIYAGKEYTETAIYLLWAVSIRGKSPGLEGLYGGRSYEVDRRFARHAERFLRLSFKPFNVTKDAPLQTLRKAEQYLINLIKELASGRGLNGRNEIAPDKFKRVKMPPGCK